MSVWREVTLIETDYREKVEVAKDALVYFGFENESGMETTDVCVIWNERESFKLIGCSPIVKFAPFPFLSPGEQPDDSLNDGDHFVVLPFFSDIIDKLVTEKFKHKDNPYKFSLYLKRYQVHVRKIGWPEWREQNRPSYFTPKMRSRFPII